MNNEFRDLKSLLRSSFELKRKERFSKTVGNQQLQWRNNHDREQITKGIFVPDTIN